MITKQKSKWLWDLLTQAEHKHEIVKNHQCSATALSLFLNQSGSAVSRKNCSTARCAELVQVIAVITHLLSFRTSCSPSCFKQACMN